MDKKLRAMPIEEKQELQNKALEALNGIRSGNLPFKLEGDIWAFLQEFQKKAIAYMDTTAANVALELEQKLALGLPEDDPTVADLREQESLAKTEVHTACQLYYATYLHAQISGLLSFVDGLSAVELKVEPLRVGAKVPEYKTDGAAGLDLCYCPDTEPNAPIVIYDMGAHLVPTGLRVEIPKGYVGKLYIRSGLAKNDHLTLANGVGIIDSDYRGEVMVMLSNQGMSHVTLKAGERIAQLIIERVPSVSIKVTSQLSETERGEGGFGSTGLE